MCGRFGLNEKLKNIEKRFGITKIIGSYRESYNFAPSQDIPLIYDDGKTRTLRMTRWGLVPQWADSPNIGYKMINARMETIRDKSTYSHAFAHGQCVIPATGFYEWKREEKTKQPYFVYPENGIFVFAGMWETWSPNNDPNAEALRTCTIITMPADKSISSLHPRMPVMLNEQNIGKWLDKNTTKSDALELLYFDGTKLNSYPVSPAVNSVKNDDAELMLPVELEEPEQKVLF